MNKKINYKEYLISKHWLSFRKEILSKRFYCERCGVKKKQGVVFNLHHTNYLCLWAEKDEDIVVLCQDCHAIIHKKTIKKTKPPKRKVTKKVKTRRQSNGKYVLWDNLSKKEKKHFLKCL